MGMHADVLAIGPFSPQVQHLLDYDSSYYDGVSVGTKVLASLFYCHTTDTSKELAEILGFDAWDFSKHNIDCDKIKLDELRNWCGIHGDPDDWVRFEGLRKNGFEFYYQPNG